VNGYSIDLGPEGRRAVRLLFDKARESGASPAFTRDLFVAAGQPG
jgi:predicted solute-binding protein